MGKLAFLIGLAVVLGIIFFAGVETTTIIGVVTFFAALTFLGLTTKRYEPEDHEETS